MNNEDLVTKVRELGFKVSEHQIVTIAQLAKFIADSADFDKLTIKPCDFTLVSGNNPDEEYAKALEWYGLKTLHAGFSNESAIDVVVDHYGGGAIATKTLYDNMCDEVIAKTIESTIIASVDEWDGCHSADRKVLIDWEVN